jgi:hypothetical protein
VFRLPRKKQDLNPRELRSQLLELLRLVSVAKGKVEREEWRLRSLARGREEVLGQLLLQLYAIERLLEMISLRLNTLIVVGYVDWRSIALAMDLVRQTLARYRGLPPELTSQLATMQTYLTNIWAGIEGSLGDEVSPTALSEVRGEASKVIEEAEEEARRRSGSTSSGTPIPLG